MMRRPSPWLFALLALLFFLRPLPVLAASDMAISSLAQQGRHHEIIAELQPLLDRGETVSTFQLLFLGAAYYEVRQYRGVTAAAEAMDKRIAQGDSTTF